MQRSTHLFAEFAREHVHAHNLLCIFRKSAHWSEEVYQQKSVTRLEAAENMDNFTRINDLFIYVSSRTEIILNLYYDGVTTCHLLVYSVLNKNVWRWRDKFQCAFIDLRPVVRSRFFLKNRDPITGRKSKNFNYFFRKIIKIHGNELRVNQARNF